MNAIDSLSTVSFKIDHRFRHLKRGTEYRHLCSPAYKSFDRRIAQEGDVLLLCMGTDAIPFLVLKDELNGPSYQAHTLHHGSAYSRDDKAILPLCEVSLQDAGGHGVVDHSIIVVYRDVVSGNVYGRAYDEFFDGRFERLDGNSS